MFNKVLIANRGSIAVRLCRTLNAMGISSVTVFADADRDSLHTTVSSESLSLGKGGVSETYLNIEKIVAACLSTGAEGVLPGYGFLSESADFAKSLEDNGIAFIGPRPEHLTQFGLKHEARRLALNAGVNLLAGSGVLTSESDAIDAANEIGYPVMLKSSAGGGGIGMQQCDDESELGRAFDSVMRLAENAFGDPRLFVESYIRSPRHVEVQAFGDGLGKVMILGDRDCSLQRRHQKVIEECPAPNLPEAVRSRMHEDARALLSSVSYRSAGTVEFLYDPVRESAAFLEVNTRLQVEHGVTELVYGVDIVRCMVELAANELAPLDELAKDLTPNGVAIQARVCAEDPLHDFRPTPGQLSVVKFPDRDDLRVDTWVRSGCEISPLYDSLLAKVIAHRAVREQARESLASALQATILHGTETNLSYLSHALACLPFKAANHHTGTLADLDYCPHTVEVSATGAQTTVQAYPGRLGYWHVGIPPSGPMDDQSFRIGNRLLGNEEGTPGLEITVMGPSLTLNAPTWVLVAGQVPVEIENENGVRSVDTWRPIHLKAGDQLHVGKVIDGVRAYILFRGGLDIPDVMGSAATFSLGRIGGFNGRTLAVGDVLRLKASAEATESATSIEKPAGFPPPNLEARHVLRITLGPHCTEDFLTSQDMKEFLDAQWTVHFNSSRTGIRLIGPKPKWARTDGGDAGLHPSNIHDNAYSFGAIDFTGDMPVILGPDGPSLGGFVCPGAVIEADRWKLGQLKGGDTLRLLPVSESEANRLTKQRDNEISSCANRAYKKVAKSKTTPESPIVFKTDDICVRRAAQEFLLVEFGPNVLDLELRLQVHQLEEAIKREQHPDILETTSGIRSLLIRFDAKRNSSQGILNTLEPHFYASQNPVKQVSSRVVRLPLSWDDPACKEAIDRYVHGVRADAPWCPDNIEFIRRINGLPSQQSVKDIVFDAEYLVMGLGDVYLGAPVATPVDPRHRLVTTKYNPARTWTAPNSVGIGGAYLCIYGMEGPGGYQFVGRTVQVWDQNRRSKMFDKYWLLRTFDRIEFYEVDHKELLEMRAACQLGELDVEIEEGVFDLDKYRRFMREESSSIKAFQDKRQTAFSHELEEWKAKGLLTFDAEESPSTPQLSVQDQDEAFVSSPLTGSIWSVSVNSGQEVKAGDTMFVIESMKAEFEVSAPQAGVVSKILVSKGQTVQAGQALALAVE